MVKIKVEITSAGGAKVATIDPAKGTSDLHPEFTLNYLVYDRASFSDTFEL